MRFGTLVRAAGLGAASALCAAAATADDGYRHGRVRIVEPGVTLQRATESTAEEALANQPFLPGDRVWTDGYGRTEFQFPDGTAVRLDSKSKLDYSGHEEGRTERIVLRLWSGSLVVRVRTREAGHFEIETPAGTVEALDQAMVRVDVDGGEARVSTYRGEAQLDDGHSRVRIAEGERTFVRWGEAAEEPRSFDIHEQDDFSRWDEQRDAEDDRAARSSEYLPRELNPYAGEFESNGNWRYEAEVGFVWSPRVGAGWSPYSNGSWSWTPYGWTWIPNESWGWAPFHYGRWGFSAGFGWYWAPGRTWGPGWVSWGVGNGYVGWCPLGWHDRPVYAWGGQQHGFAVTRFGGTGGWNVVHEGDFGHRNLAQHRVPLAGLDPQALRVADSPNLRPTRDARALRAANPETHAISRRPSPGDFVRELSVDNKYTIPATWLHEGHARADTARSREARDVTAGASPRGESRREAAGESRASGGESAQAAARGEAVRREPQRSRGDDGVRSNPPRRDDGSAERPRREETARPSSRSESAHENPRAERAQPRETSARSDAGSSRTRETASPRGGRSESGGQSRGGGHGESSGQSHGSGHSDSRPHDH